VAAPANACEKSASVQHRRRTLAGAGLKDKTGRKTMRSLLLLAAGSLLAAAPAAQAGPRDDAETRIARAVEGRVAGEPVDCISLNRVRSSQMIDDEAIIFDAGSTIYVNRPRAGRESLDEQNTLISRTSTSRLCSIDTMQVYDPALRTRTGVVFLGEFIPYRRVPSSR
jgi:hypothetical protein